LVHLDWHQGEVAAATAGRAATASEGFGTTFPFAQP
jgi:hypothetical protein